MTLLEFHVLISLVEIAAGLIMLYGLITGRAFGVWTALFLATAILTSLTGFPLAPFGFDPPRAIGILTLVLLAVAVGAYYLFQLAGAWRWIYVVTALLALYLDVFVGVIQSFMKIPSLHVLAPTQSEPPFLVAQAVVLALFVVLGFLALRKFHPAKFHSDLAPTA
ncbi:MAG: hypothetical protein WBB34_21920 [Xanthobacteraceae bacterium]